MVTTRGPGFVGRSAERVLLHGPLARVRAGESEALVTRGETGVGKTPLLRYTARQAAGFQAAQLTGVEAEWNCRLRACTSCAPRYLTESRRCLRRRDRP